MPLGVVDRRNPVCYLLPVIHNTFGRVSWTSLSSAFRVNCRQDVSACCSVPVEKGRVKKSPFPRWEGARKSQVVRTGFLEPQTLFLEFRPLIGKAYRPS